MSPADLERLKLPACSILGSTVSVSIATLNALVEEAERLQRENAELRESRDMAHELLRAK